MKEDRLPSIYCQRRLTMLWLIGGGASFLLLFIQATGGKHDATVSEWLLPAIVPTLTLMIGALVTLSMAAKPKEGEEPPTSDRFLYRVAMGMSAFYLLLLFVVLVQSAFGDIKETIKSVGLMITSVQGLVGLALGAFFVKK